MTHQTFPTKQGTYTLDDVFRISDNLTRGDNRLYGDTAFKAIKEATGIPMSKLRPLFKARLSDTDIIAILRQTPPDMPFYEKYRPIKRITLGQMNSAHALLALMRVIAE